VTAAPYIIALDPATTTGIAAGYANETPSLGSMEWRHKASDRQLDLLARAASWWSHRLTSGRRPDIVAIETPIRPTWGASNHDAMTLSNRLYGIFAGCAAAAGAEVLEVEVRTWRKHFCRGNPPKGEGKAHTAYMCRLLGWIPADDNQADAAGIWSYAVGRSAPLHLARHMPLFTRSA
jgi:hypothetical protein